MSIQERIDMCSIPITESGCWIWVGGSTSAGYGIIYYNKKWLYAHRASWEVHNHRKIPPRKMILHKCDIPSCVNPDHLYLGTHTDNVRDMVNRKRYPDRSGENQIGRRVLTWKQVREIRLSKESARAMARKYKVVERSIHSIRSFGSWKNDPEKS